MEPRWFSKLVLQLPTVNLKEVRHKEKQTCCLDVHRPWRPGLLINIWWGFQVL